MRVEFARNGPIIRRAADLVSIERGQEDDRMLSSGASGGGAGDRAVEVRH